MSGISILRNLLLKQAVKESGQASGIMSIGDSVRKLVERRLQSYLVSAANKGIDLDKFSEAQIKYMLEMNNPYNKAKMQLRKEQGIKSADVLDMKGQKLDPNQPIIGGTQQTTSLDDEIKQAYNKAVKEGKLENVRLKDGRKIKSEEDFRNYIDELNEDNNLASGGRAGFKMGRRAFLKLMGGVGAGIGALKTGILKLAGKGAASQAAKEIITTPAAANKPEWFDALVTRIVNEGTDVTKKYATKDREVVHLAKIDEDSTAVVYRDLDTGTVRVDINDPTKHVVDEQGNAIVTLEVRGGQLEEGIKGKTPAEFDAVETDYRNYTTSPDGDYDTESIENVVSNTKDLTADLTKVKIYARGDNKPTLKELVESKKREAALKKADENPAGYAADRGPDYDPPEPDDFASGGLAGMLGE